MDISDINKVASRKRMNTDVEKLKEKVSRETAKIIKLKVAQDTAYWDLKEKLQQLEANHERLQQNMVEVQMQHEAISGQYQEELRLRPDTLNKLSGTRHICDVLEEYGERLRRGVARCRADQQALGAAYGACGARVRALGGRARDGGGAAARRLRRALERAGAARARGDLLEAARRDLAERLERALAELTRREESATALQADVARLLRECDAQCAELRRAGAARDAELSAEQGARRAGERREAAALQQRDAARRRLQAERAEAASTIEQLKAEVSSLTEDKRRMEKLIDERDQRVATLEKELGSAQDRFTSAEASRRKTEQALCSARQTAEAAEGRADELATRAAALQAAAVAAQAAAAVQRAEDARRMDELGASVANRDRELDDKARTITRLMADLKAEAEARARCDSAATTERRRHDAERTDLAAALARLEAAARAKDDEIGAQLRVILDMRAERERLQERVRAKQATIDNIQMELTGRAPPPPLHAAAERERDAAPPGPPADSSPAPARPRVSSAPAPPGARVACDADALYGFLSDGSVDGDVLDAREVGRRFEALANADLPLHAMRPQAAVSLSQVKKNIKMKSRTFFKNKRLESKLKKLKE